jgi:hypothetical protein
MADRTLISNYSELDECFYDGWDTADVIDLIARFQRWAVDQEFEELRDVFPIILELSSMLKACVADPVEDEPKQLVPLYDFLMLKVKHVVELISDRYEGDPVKAEKYAEAVRPLDTVFSTEAYEGCLEAEARMRAEAEEHRKERREGESGPDLD